MKRAVVLSGGGAYGAYSAGVLAALVHGRSPATGYRPLVPDLLTGTSVGSFNAAFLVAHWRRRGGPAAVDDLIDLWRERLADNGRGGNGVYRVRGDPLEIFHPRKVLADPIAPFLTLVRDGARLATDALSRTTHFLRDPDDESIEQRFAELFDLSVVLSIEPLRETLRYALERGDVEGSPIALEVAVTDWTNGGLRLFTNREMTPDRAPWIVGASSAIPGIFPPQRIDGAIYVDGGVLMNTPLKPALESNAREIHVVFLDPDVRRIPLRSPSSSIGTLHRTQMIAWSALVREKVGNVAGINAGVEILERLGARFAGGEDPEGWDSPALLAEIGRVAGLDEKELDYLRGLAPYRVHNYFPRTGSSGGGPLGFLNFGRRRIDDLLERGYRDALEHDCARNRCVLPAGAVESSAAPAEAGAS